MLCYRTRFVLCLHSAFVSKYKRRIPIVKQKAILDNESKQAISSGSQVRTIDRAYRGKEKMKTVGEAA